TDWSALVLSGDGHELAATRGGVVYVSTNLGATFTPTTGTGSVFATSSDGSVILAVSGSNTYASLDRGSTWTSNSAPAAFSHFAASSTAQKLVATDGSFNVYTSTNFGATWRQGIVPYSPTYGLASSADGSRLYGAGDNGSGETYVGWVYGSTNSGNTWASVSQFGGMVGFGAIACSADGSIIAAGGEAMVISINGGASWSGNDSLMYVGSISSSGDGHTLITEPYGVILVSPDTGTNWFSANISRFSSGVAVMTSQDGSTFTVFNGAIYLSQPFLTGSLQVNLAPPQAVAAGAQWQLDSGDLEASGTTVTPLAVGNHSISFIPIAGWTTPSNLTVTISDNQTTLITGTYVQQTGALQVNLAPAAAVSAGAQWQVDGGALQNSGATVSGLPVGNHTVSFTTVSGWMVPSNLVVSISNNLTNVLTATYLPADALQVNLAPPAAVAAGAAWQLDGGFWQTNGATVTGLTPGSHTVSFAAVSGWTTPSGQSFSITNNQTNVITGTYIQQFGSLQVNILPSTAVAEGALWRVDGGAWQGSGAISGGLAAGNHTVSFMGISGWATPASLTASVTNYQTNVLTATYLQVGSLQVNLTPPGAVSAGAAWQVDGGPAQTNGAVVGGLVVGGHTVSFTTISRWTTPTNQWVNIAANLTNVIQGLYTPPTVVTNADPASFQRALAGGGTVNFSCDGAILLTNTITISNNTVVDASGHNITISGGGSVEIFAVNSNSLLELNDLTLADGLASVTYLGPFVTFGGGAISNGGALQVVQCLFSNNSAAGYAVNGVNESAASAGLGGAIYSIGSLDVSNATFVGNTALGGQAPDEYTAAPDGGQGGGGAVYSTGSALIASCTFVSNTATGGNGGTSYFPEAPGGSGGQATGGAICNTGTLLLLSSTCLQNTVSGGRGGTGGQGMAEGPSLNGAAGGAAGAGNGGALCSLSGNATVVNCTIANNSTFGGQGGVGGSGASPYYGEGAQGGAGGNGGNGGNGVGGGICLLGGTLSLTNVTCANNLSSGGTAGSGGAGGSAIIPGPPGANGQPGVAQGDTIADSGSSFLVLNSILDCVAGGTNGFGPILDAGYNINSDSTDFLTNIASLNNTNPLLGTLGFYGGPTETIPLLAGSPAIDAADPFAFPPTDQRGNPRPAGPEPDIGAFESSLSFISGSISGLWPPDQATVCAGPLFHCTTNGGEFGFTMPCGSYTLWPSNANYVFWPASQSVTIGASGTNLLFQAYRANAITLGTPNNGVLPFAFAGSNSQSFRILASSNLVQWRPVSTNVLGPNAFMSFIVPTTNSSSQFYRAVSP
ncbi:MAG: choice-of-anchor Q domain-containing protein, partial [Verrucomicrobiota bacterium]